MFCWEATNKRGEVWRFEAKPILLNGYWHSGIGASKFVRYDAPVVTLVRLEVRSKEIADHIWSLYEERMPAIIDYLNSKLRESLPGNIHVDGDKGGRGPEVHEGLRLPGREWPGAPTGDKSKV